MDSGTRCTELTPQALMTYVYDEGEPSERERVDAHLAACRVCSAELASLRSTRGALTEWTPPDPECHVRIVSDTHGPPAGWWTMRIPSWGLAAAASLVLVVGAAIASVEIRYDNEGFAFRMGWTERGDVGGAGGDQVGQTEAVTVAPTVAQEVIWPAGGEAPWSADLASLEGALRSELARRVPERGADPGGLPQSAGVRNDAPVLEQVEGLILDSERRQRQELALWFTEFAQEFDMQRRADQQRVQQELGALEGVADYLVSVSQR